MDRNHYPVMNSEVLEAVQATSGRLFVDCTLGMGGHSARVLQACPDIRVVAVDQDLESLQQARTRLAAFADRVSFVHGDFCDLPDLHPIAPASVSALLIDPGLSMVQLASAERGFSHRYAGPLDMRKDRRQTLTAADVVNGYSFERLLDVLRRYGEVDQAERIVESIVHHRIRNPFQTTVELSGLIETVCKWHPRPGSLHPAARVFQAIRIEVNGELARLADFISRLPTLVEKGGRILILTYHSVEDRLVKQAGRELARQKIVELVKPSPRLPSSREVEENFPSRSAKLRDMRVR